MAAHGRLFSRLQLRPEQHHKCFLPASGNITSLTIFAHRNFRLPAFTACIHGSAATAPTAMDPLTALGLAANIIQLVDYSTKVINGAREIYGSASGITEEHRSLQSIVIQMKELSSKLLPTTGTSRSDDEEAVCRVAAECNIISDQILELLGKIKPKNSKSKHQVALAAVKNKFREKGRSELEKRLVNCRSQLELHLNVLTRLHSLFPSQVETNIVVRTQRLG